jgi:hypothetical protein
MLYYIKNNAFNKNILFIIIKINTMNGFFKTIIAGYGAKN